MHARERQQLREDTKEEIPWLDVSNMVFIQLGPSSGRLWPTVTKRVDCITAEIKWHESQLWDRSQNSGENTLCSDVGAQRSQAAKAGAAGKV